MEDFDLKLFELRIDIKTHDFKLFWSRIEMEDSDLKLFKIGIEMGYSDLKFNKNFKTANFKIIYIDIYTEEGRGPCVLGEWVKTRTRLRTTILPQ